MTVLLSAVQSLTRCVESPVLRNRVAGGISRVACAQHRQGVRSFWGKLFSKSEEEPRIAKKDRTDQNQERTLALIKPDALRGGAGYGDVIIDAILFAKFKVTHLTTKELTLDESKEFNKEHRKKEFFAKLNKSMTSGPSVAMILEREDAVAAFRAMVGPTDPKEAKKSHPHTLRAIHGFDICDNAVHGSDSKEAAEREIAFFFPEKVRCSGHDSNNGNGNGNGDAKDKENGP